MKFQTVTLSMSYILNKHILGMLKSGNIGLQNYFLNLFILFFLTLWIEKF